MSSSSSLPGASPLPGVSAEGRAELRPEDPVPAGSRSGPRGRQLALPTVLLALVRRELWEHRELWVAPVAVAVLLIAMAFPSDLGLISFDFSGYLSVPGMRLPSATGVGLLAELGKEQRQALFGLEHWILSWVLYLVMVLVLSFYLADCLYAERKDRSILFWKSLPVSDLVTVVSKALVGLVLVPLGVYVLALVTDLLFTGIWRTRAYFGTPSALLLPWDTVSWLKVQGLMGLGVIYSILWYAPVGGYLLLVSAWAKRNAVLWASLPPVLLPIAERMALGTSYTSTLLYQRSLGVLDTPVIQDALAESQASFGGMHVVSLPRLYDLLPVVSVFTNIQLWAGVAVTVALLLLTARIRRYRDEA